MAVIQKTDVTWFGESSRTAAIASGFKRVALTDHWSHIAYPGVVFREVTDLSQLAARGGAMVLLKTAVAPAFSVYSGAKLLFGEQIAEHFLRDADGNYPRLGRLPVPRAPYVIEGERLGIRGGTPGIALTEALIGVNGTEWLDVFSGTQALVLAFDSRVEHGFAYNGASGVGVTDFKPMFQSSGSESGGQEPAALLEANPSTMLSKGAAIVRVIDNITVLTLPALYVPGTFGYRVGASGGAIWVSTPCRPGVITHAGADEYIDTWPAELQDEAATELNRAMGLMPEWTKFALPMSVSMPTAGGQKLKFSFDVPELPKLPIGTFFSRSVGVAAPDSPANITSTVLTVNPATNGGGRHAVPAVRWPEPVLRAPLTHIGNGNETCTAAPRSRLPGVTGSFTLMELPRFKLGFPERAATEGESAAAVPHTADGPTEHAFLRCIGPYATFSANAAVVVKVGELYENENLTLRQKPSGFNTVAEAGADQISASSSEASSPRGRWRAGVAELAMLEPTLRVMQSALLDADDAMLAKYVDGN